MIYLDIVFICFLNVAIVCVFLFVYPIFIFLWVALISSFVYFQ